MFTDVETKNSVEMTFSTCFRFLFISHTSCTNCDRKVFFLEFQGASNDTNVVAIGAVIAEIGGLRVFHDTGRTAVGAPKNRLPYTEHSQV